jgi:hypothetical protein
VKKCQEEIKQARPDKVLEPERERVDVRADKAAAEKDQVQVPAVVQAKGKAEVKDEAKAKAKAKVKAKEEIAKKEVCDMPGFDRTGPQGAGPMTGGRRGFCNPASGDIQPAYGRGYGYGAQRGGRLGLGRGFRGARSMGRRFVPGDVGYAQPEPPLSTTENEGILAKLKEGVDSMNASLSSMNRVLSDLKDRMKASPE